MELSIMYILHCGTYCCVRIRYNYVRLGTYLGRRGGGNVTRKENIREGFIIPLRCTCLPYGNQQL